MVQRLLNLILLTYTLFSACAGLSVSSGHEVGVTAPLLVFVPASLKPISGEKMSELGLSLRPRALIQL